MLSEAKVDVYAQNLMKAMPISFTEVSAEAKYLVLTRAMAPKGMSPDEFTGEVQSTAPIFADSGALTMRLGHIIAGSNA